MLYVVEIMIPGHPSLGVEEQVRLYGISDAPSDVGGRLDEGVVDQKDVKSGIELRSGDRRGLSLDIARLHAGEIVKALTSENELADVIVAADRAATNDAARGVIAEIDRDPRRGTYRGTCRGNSKCAQGIVPAGSRRSAPDVDADPAAGPGVDGTRRRIRPKRGYG